MSEVTTDRVEECRRALDTDGYAVVRGVVSGEGLARFDDMLEAEFERFRSSDAFHGGGMFSGHLNCIPGTAARFAWDEVNAAGIVDIVKGLNPDWAVRPRATLNFNMPGSHAQHYHMDGVYTRDFLICNIAVVDTDIVNGAIDVLPGTNQRFYRFWQYATQRIYRGSTRLPLQRGDVVLRRSTLWHRGMPNYSDAPRPMLAFTFGEYDEPVDDPFAGDRADLEFYPNWFAPTRRGRLRERTFVAAPITYSAYRFTRSLFSDKGYAH